MLRVREHVPVAYRVTFNCTIFRIVGESLKSLGIMPKYQDILTTGALTCRIDDRIKGYPLYKYSNCRATTTAFDVTARGVTAENIGFVATHREDEADL